MRKLWRGAAVVALGATILGGSAAGASVRVSQVGPGDDDAPAASGTIDDGKELLSRARITLEQAIQAAQGSASGSIGEVDLEYRHGILVFNVDVGDQDIKVDAGTGQVLAMVADD